MKHSVCGGWIEIRTDPKNTAYVVTEGGRRKDTGPGEGEYFDEDGKEGTSEIKLGLEKKTEEDDPFARLEGKVDDKNRFLTAKQRMGELMDRQNRDWQDPYENSKKLRRAFRAERKNRDAAAHATELLKDKMSLDIELLEENEGDRARAELVDFNTSTGTSPASPNLQSTSRPLFESNKPASKPSPLSSENSKKDNNNISKRGKTRSKATNISAERKALLHQELSGNTRAAIDPFLSDVKVWQPGTKKRKFTEQNPPAVTGDIHESAHGTAKRNEPSDGDKWKSDDKDGLTGPQPATKNQKPESRPTLLVDYGSSDTE